MQVRMCNMAPRTHTRTAMELGATVIGKLFVGSLMAFLEVDYGV